MKYDRLEGEKPASTNVRHQVQINKAECKIVEVWTRPQRRFESRTIGKFVERGSNRFNFCNLLNQAAAQLYDVTSP
jgi:hypothetical protein